MRVLRHLTIVILAIQIEAIDPYALVPRMGMAVFMEILNYLDGSMMVLIKLVVVGESDFRHAMILKKPRTNHPE